MAYKDEYEVARLYTDGAFRPTLRQQFEGDFRLEFHLAPPLFAARDPDTGHLQKRSYGPWMLRAFALLARLKRLRGTALDPFGRTAERRMERRLIAEYERDRSRAARRPRAPKSRPRRRDRAAARAHPRLRPRQGAQRRRGQGARGRAARGFRRPVPAATAAE